MKLNQQKKKLIEKNLIYERNKQTFNFNNLKRQDILLIAFLVVKLHYIFSSKITLSEAYQKQSNLLKNILEFSNRVKISVKADKQEKKDALESIKTHYQGREEVIN